MDLRKAFFEILLEMAKADKDIVCMVGDLGFSFCEQFQKELPNQFINVGCIEQTMIGIATGMALGGKKPYVYSGSVFLLMRPYEQIRNLCYNNIGVKLCGTGASPFLGFSHNLEGSENEEDLLKNLPNLKRHYPQSEKELKEIMFNKNNSPEFIRI